MLSNHHSPCVLAPQLSLRYSSKKSFINETSKIFLLLNARTHTAPNVCIYSFIPLLMNCILWSRIRWTNCSLFAATPPGGATAIYQCRAVDGGARHSIKPQLPSVLIKRFALIAPSSCMMYVHGVCGVCGECCCPLTHRVVHFEHGSLV